MTATQLLGRAPVFLKAVALIERIALYDVPVVIEGETGTGKELAARAIHYGGSRRDGAFVPVNAGALPDTLLESELFGYERGAFTDARTAQPGLVEVADGGTLFLDEVDSLSPRAQVMLLRFLQDHEYRPLGSRTTRSSDARIIAASNRSLQALVEAGTFRADLLFRLRLMSVMLPPLRARPGDARLLTHTFIDALNAHYNQPPKHASAQLDTWVDVQRWPGNVRELENLVHRRYLLTEGAEITIEAAAESADVPAGESSAIDYNAAKAAALADFDRRFLRALLEQTRGNVTWAARVAHKERRALGKMIRKYGFRPELFRAS